MESFFDPMPRVIAHRGDSHNFPENTIGAFESAIKHDVDVIETDVHLTKDGVIVIWHDDTLERNTDGKGRIEDHTLEELMKFDAGYTFTQDGGRTFPFRGKGVRIATIEEVFRKFPDQRFNVDLKTKSPDIVKEFSRLVKKYDMYDRVICASFHYSNLKAMRKYDERMLTSLTTCEVVPLLIRKCLHILPGHPKRKLIFQIPDHAGPIKVSTRSFCTAMHRIGAVIQVWTINDEETMNRLFDNGVDAIMTNNPQLLQKVCRERDSRKG